MKLAFYKPFIVEYLERFEGGKNMTELAYGSPAEFEKGLRESPTPCLVDFYADWCGPCKMLKPEIEALEKEYEGRMKVIKVNTDSHSDLTKHFGIRGIPTIMFFAKGKKQWEQVGVPSARNALTKKVAEYMRTSR